MKKLLISVYILIIMIFLTAFKSYTYNSFPLIGKLIIIDAGHGGHDPGATYGKIYEKEYNLRLAKILKNELENNGATVLMTRNSDIDLSDASAKNKKKSDFDNRIKIANDNLANLFISLHMNYINNNKYYGAQLYYTDNLKANKKISSILQNDLNDKLQQKYKIKKIGNNKYLYKRLKIPSILIEYGFLSNSYDRKRLNAITYNKKIAKIITNSLIDYFT